MSDGLALMRRRARRVFLRKWSAPAGALAQLRAAGAREELVWEGYWTAFFDGWCDHVESRERELAREFSRP